MKEPPEIEFNHEPMDAASYVEQGKAYIQQRELDLAIADYDTAIRLDPHLIEAYMRRGDTYIRQGNLDGAIADYSKAIEVNLRYTALMYWDRARVYERQGKLEHAIADYGKLVEINPEEAAFYHFMRGNCYLNRGDLENAIADYDTLIGPGNIRPGNSPRAVHNNRGIVLCKMGRLEDAAADFEKVVEEICWLQKLRRSGKHISEVGGVGMLELNDATAYSIRGGIFFAKGVAEEARRDYEAARKLGPNNPSILAWRAISLHAVGRVDDAASAWKQLVYTDERFRDAEWAGKELGWGPGLIEKARKVIAAI